MRVLDLLQLLADQPKNTPIRVQTSQGVQNIADFTTQTIREQPQLVLISKTDGKPLKCWELRLLLDQPQWRQHYLYAQTDDELRPLFGWQARNGELVIN